MDHPPPHCRKEGFVPAATWEYYQKWPSVTIPLGDCQHTASPGSHTLFPAWLVSNALWMWMTGESSSQLRTALKGHLHCRAFFRVRQSLNWGCIIANFPHYQCCFLPLPSTGSDPKSLRNVLHANLHLKTCFLRNSTFFNSLGCTWSEPNYHKERRKIIKRSWVISSCITNSGKRRGVVQIRNNSNCRVQPPDHSLTFSHFFLLSLALSMVSVSFCQLDKF